MKTGPLDEHNVKSPVRRLVSRLARGLGFEYHDLLLAITDLNTFHDAPVNSSSVSVSCATGEQVHTVANLLSEPVRYWFEQARSWESDCYLLTQDGSLAGFMWANQRIVFYQDVELIALPASVALSTVDICSRSFGAGGFSRYCSGTLISPSGNLGPDMWPPWSIETILARWWRRSSSQGLFVDPARF